MQGTKLYWAMALALTSLLCLPPAAQARDARCRIIQDGKVSLDRICDFQPDGRNGSFSLTGRGGRGSLLPGVSVVSVSVIDPGVAEVRGLTRGGINSRWGEARRSGRDRACWDGAGFRVCVY
jgi:hypothetical protein